MGTNENAPRMDFAALVTDKVLRTYFKYPIIVDKVLLNKRGKPKKHFKQGPPPAASVVAPIPSGEPSTKRTRVKKTRAKKAAYASIFEDPTAEAPTTEAHPSGATTTEAPVLGVPMTSASMPTTAEVSVTEALSLGHLHLGLLIPGLWHPKVPQSRVFTRRCPLPQSLL